MEEHNDYSGEEIDLRGLIEVLWRRKWLILAIVLVAVAVAGFFSFFVISPVYEASVLVELRFPEQIEKKEAYRLQIRDPYFLSQVIEKLQLDPQKYDPFSFREALNVEVPGNTNFLKITVKNGDSQKIAEVANAIASQFVDFAIYSTQEDVKKELLSLEEGMKEWQNKLDEIGRKKRDFLIQSDIETLERELEAKKVLWGSFQKDLLLLEVQKRELQATLEKAKEKLESEPPYLKLRQSAFGNLAGENITEGIISGLFPFRMESEVVNVVYNVLKEQAINLETQLSGIEARKKSMQETAREVQTELKNLEGTLLEKMVERDQIQGEYDSTLEIYNSFVRKYRENQVYSMSEEVNAGVRIVSPALPPQVPISPRKMLNIAIAGVLGIFVGIIAAFVVEYWKKTTPSPEK
ncbi:MAG: hypothetical protein PWP57_391 [Candidatus Atribacteria bacterium]|nr:hypothetical protein [Candidatus Atribacteria bacterium]